MFFRFYKGRGTMSKMINMLERLKIVEKAENEKKEGGANQIKPLENHNEKQSTSDMYQQVQNNVNTKTVKPAGREESNSGYEKISYDKNKSIEEIYEAYELTNSNINTIFMLGNFINALPENLPYAVRKSSVMNIINA